MGNFYFRLAKPDQAQEAYQKAVEIAPDNIKYQMVLAGFYSATGEKDEALATYRKALEIEPENVQVMHAVARFYLDQGDFDEAEKQIAEILEKRSNYFPARMLQGELLAKKRDFPAAIQIFDQLIEEEPGSAQANYFKAVSHYGLGDLELAKSSTTRAAPKCTMWISCSNPQTRYTAVIIISTLPKKRMHSAR